MLCVGFPQVPIYFEEEHYFVEDNYFEAEHYFVETTATTVTQHEQNLCEACRTNCDFQAGNHI